MTDKMCGRVFVATFFICFAIDMAIIIALLAWVILDGGLSGIISVGVYLLASGAVVRTMIKMDEEDKKHPPTQEELKRRADMWCSNPYRWG